MTNVVPLEAAVVRRIMRVLANRGAWHVKTTGVSKVGCPDIIACYKGQFLGIEVKRPGGKTSRKQELELRRVVDAGGYGFVAYDDVEVEAVLALIDSDAKT